MDDFFMIFENFQQSRYVRLDIFTALNRLNLNCRLVVANSLIACIPERGVDFFLHILDFAKTHLLSRVKVCSIKWVVGLAFLS